MENPYVYKAKDLTIEVYEDYEICLDCGAVMDDEGNCPRCDNEDKLDFVRIVEKTLTIVIVIVIVMKTVLMRKRSQSITRNISRGMVCSKSFEKPIIKNYFLNNFEKSLKAVNHPMTLSVLDRYEAIKQDLTPEILLKFFKENNIGASIDPLMLDMAEKMFS